MDVLTPRASFLLTFMAAVPNLKFTGRCKFCNYVLLQKNFRKTF